MLNSKADYKNSEKEIARILDKRNKDKLKLEKEIAEQKALIEKAKEIKKGFLETGTKEEYLKACEDLVREENSLEYLLEKAKQLRNSNKVTVENLEKAKKEIRKEQDRMIGESLKQFEAEVKKLKAIRLEALEELARGSRMYERLKKAFDEDATPEEKEKIQSNRLLSEIRYPATFGLVYTGTYFDRDIKNIEKDLENSTVKSLMGKN